LDMIPFGHLQIWNPRENRGSGVDDGNEELSGKGFERMSGLTRDQKLTFITMRALAASPLFMGGDLPTSDEDSLQLITHPRMIECNRNGVTGRLAYRSGGMDVWTAPHRDDPENRGWIGVFNRTLHPQHAVIPLTELGFRGMSGDGSGLAAIWPDSRFEAKNGFLHSDIPADGVLFLEFRRH